MELFLEFVLTIAFSLLLSFFLAKILSLSSTSDFDHHESSLRSCEEVIEKAVKQERELEGESKRYGFESETKLGFVAKVAELDELGGLIDFTVEKLWNDSFGSFKAHDGVKTEENEALRELEIVGPIEKKAIEERLREDEENLVDESTEREKIGKTETNLIEDKMIVAKSEGEIEVFNSEADNKIEGAEKNGEDCVEEAVVDEDDDDDWEGIERTELERLFGSAMAFVGSKSNADRIKRLDGDVKMQLYGLHKIAIEGPCYETQPMALKVSARAKWNAWQQLGNMSPEVAMEQYVTLLSRSLPGWMEDDIGGDNNQVMAHAEASGELASDSNTLLGNHPASRYERNPDVPKPCVEGLDVIGSVVRTH